MRSGSEFFTKGENFAYRANLFFLRVTAAMDINQLILAGEGRVDEMTLTRVEQLEQQRSKEIQRRKSIISNG